MRTSTPLLAALLIACQPSLPPAPAPPTVADAGRGADLDPPVAAELDAGEDLGRAPAPPDLSAPADLVVQQAPDLLGAPDLDPPAPDLVSGADLLAPMSCGKQGIACCNDHDCGGGLICLHSGDVCGQAKTGSTCTVPINCGAGGLPCCSALGQPGGLFVVDGYVCKYTKAVQCV